MLQIVDETVRAITPHVLGVDAVGELPGPDLQASVDFLADWHQKGIPEFRVVSNLAFLTLNLYSLARKGRLFPRLDYSSQAALLERLYRARGDCSRGSTTARRRPCSSDCIERGVRSPTNSSTSSPRRR